MTRFLSVRLLCILLVAVFLGCSQPNGGVLHVYAGGFNQPTNDSGTAVPGYWLDGNWNALTPPAGSVGSKVNSLVVSGAHVYAGGYSTDSSLSGLAGYWLDGTWNALSGGESVNSLVVSGTHVFAGGSSQLGDAGYWLDGTWNALPSAGSTKSEVLSLVVSGTHVYAGGYRSRFSRGYDGMPSSSVVPGYWLDGTWNALTPPAGSTYAEVKSLVVSGTHVYAGGYCEKEGILVTGMDSVWAPGYWLDGTWNGLTPLNASQYSEVRSLVVQ